MLVEIQVHADLFSLCFTSNYLGMVLLWYSYGSLMIFLWPVDGFARVFWCFLLWSSDAFAIWSFDAFAMVLWPFCYGPWCLSYGVPVLGSSYACAVVLLCFCSGLTVLRPWSSDAFVLVLRCFCCSLPVLVPWSSRCLCHGPTAMMILLCFPKYFVMVFLCFCRGLLLFPCALRASAHGTWKCHLVPVTTTWCENLSKMCVW